MNFSQNPGKVTGTAQGKCLPTRAVNHPVIAGDHAKQGHGRKTVNHPRRFSDGNFGNHLGEGIHNSNLAQGLRIIDSTARK